MYLHCLLFLNPLPPNDVIWQQISWSVNNGLDNGMLPDGTKPLPEPMLTQDPSQSNFTENAQDMLAKIIILWLNF